MDKPDEQDVFNCGHCGVPILTFWAPDGGGLLRGEYTLAGDVIFHPKCWNERIDRWLADPWAEAMRAEVGLTS